MAATNWKRRFDEPIKLPGGGKLLTLKDAADYIMKLPKKVTTHRIGSSRWCN